MESQIVFHLSNFAMLDYKIEYTNHSQFQKGNFLLPVPPITNIAIFLQGQKEESKDLL